MDEDVIDITPEGSVAPVFLVPLEDQEYVEPLVLDEPVDQTEALASAINKLAALGLTEEEARAIAGV